jgi:hypothetical protein
MRGAEEIRVHPSACAMKFAARAPLVMLARAFILRGGSAGRICSPQVQLRAIVVARRARAAAAVAPSCNRRRCTELLCRDAAIARRGSSARRSGSALAQRTACLQLNRFGRPGCGLS